jgi:hypothetical protein
MKSKYKVWVKGINEKGVPLPTVRDPKTGEGSVSFTMVAVSFGFMATTATLTLGLFISQFLIEVRDFDNLLNTLKEAFSMGFQMTGVSSSLYGVRKYQDRRAEQSQE